MKNKNYINQKAFAKQNPNWFYKKIPYFIFILFSVFVAVGMYFHELWRDELEVYGKIAFGGSLLSAENDYSYLVYNLLMKVFLWFNESQSTYQFYHYIIIVSAIFILNKYSPFSLFENFFITFSYFLFFEYGVISRYYGFLILMVFLIMFFLSRKKVNYFLIIIPLIILAGHSVNSYVFAVSIFLFIINNIFEKYKNKLLSKKIIISYSLVFLCFLFIGIIYFTNTLKEKSHFSLLGEAPYFMTIRSVWNSFIPLPEYTGSAVFWNSNYFDFPILYPLNYDINIYYTAQNIILAVLSLLIFVIILIKFSKKPVVFWVFLINYILLLLFLHTARFYFIRHLGLLFIVFIYSYWLYHIANDKIYIPVLCKIKLDILSKLKIDSIFKSMISFFLIFQFISSFYALYKDYKYEFTLSHTAAKYIQNNYLNIDHIMVGYRDYAAQAVAINLKDKMYFPESKTYNYFWAPFDISRKDNIPTSEIFNTCIDFTEKQNRKVLLILNTPLKDIKKQPVKKLMLSQKTNLNLIKAFTGDIIQTDEQYWLYEVKKIKLQK